MVTIENWEEYAILRADGELDAAGAAALEAFLAAHPGLADEARMYAEDLRLTPDAAVVFAGVESLLKPEPRVIHFDRRWAYGVAAGVALLIGAGVYLRDGEAGGGGAGRLAGMVEMPARAENSTRSIPAPAREEEMLAVQNAEERTTTPMRKEETRRTATAPQQPTVASTQTDKEPALTTIENIAPIRPAGTQMLAVGAPQERRAAPLSNANQPTASEEEDSKEDRNILGRLPIEAERFALVDDLRATASDRLQSIRDTRAKIRNTDVTVALGRRELFTLHF